MRRDPRREAETRDMVVQRWLSGGSDNEINRCWLVAQCGTRPDFEFARGLYARSLGVSNSPLAQRPPCLAYPSRSYVLHILPGLGDCHGNHSLSSCGTVTGAAYGYWYRPVYLIWSACPRWPKACSCPIFESWTHLLLTSSAF